MTDSTRTYSTSIPAANASCAALDAYARLFSKAVRTTYAQTERDVRAKKTKTKAERKALVCAKFNITSRQANAVLVEADGKRAGILELYQVRLVDLEDRLRKRVGKFKRAQAKFVLHKEGKVLRLSKAKAKKGSKELFYHKTKIQRLAAAVEELKSLIKSGHTAMTFGTKKVLRQRAAEDLWGRDLKNWRKDWDLARNSQFLVLGSKDETAGCQGCVATANANGTYTLHLRLTDAQGGGYAVIEGVRFAYGAEQLRSALAQQDLRADSRTKLMAKAKETQTAEMAQREPLAPGEKAPRVNVSQKDIQGGIAITWRFMRQADDSWRVSFSTSVAAAPKVTSLLVGAIGVDINSGFISVAETDRFGNILSAYNIKIPEPGRSTGQRDASRGDAVKEVIARCKLTGKPLVLEALDFKAKKREMTADSEGKNRKLSALAYTDLHQLFSARALDSGVEVINIDPAYTSTQGLVLYAAQRGWTVHMAAAGVIARRGMGISEATPVSGTRSVPVGEIAVEWAIPEDIARSDVSHRWRLLHQSLRRTIALYFRERRRAAQPGAHRGRLSESEVVGGTPASNRASRPTTPR